MVKFFGLKKNLFVEISLMLNLMLKRKPKNNSSFNFLIRTK